jgi:ankyrin repeat protein
MRNLIKRTALGALLAVQAGLAGAAQAPGTDELTRYFRSLQMDDAKTVQKMIAGQVVNPNQADPRSGEPGLIVALREGAVHVAASLIALPGVDLEAEAPNGNTALMMAAFKGNRVAVEALLDKGARVNRAGWNALHFAAAGGDDAITRLLLARGAAVDARAPAGFTALMLAAREGQEATVATLLEAGADITLSNSEQLSAAQIALRAEKPRIAAAISRHGGAGR